ncbi:MAG: enoyl-CoA hydratase-related protein [Pseudomonadota bacterium]
MTAFCRTEQSDHVLTITIDRPERLNALHPPASVELAAVFDDFAANDDLWVAILTGAGRAFSAGNDLRYQAAGGERLAMPRGFGGLTSRFDLDKPVIAAVNGLAHGGGFELALACDLIIAAESAEFALPEPKVGLAALGGGLVRLPAQIGLKRAMSMILTGRRVSAAEGERLGFVNEVVPVDEVLPRSRALAGQINECSPLSIRASKAVAHAALDSPSLEAALTTRHEAVRAMLRSEDFEEGPRAFAEKRPPRWQGK